MCRLKDRYANFKNSGGEKPPVENVYELLRNSSVENDEWMYELQQKKENEKFSHYNEHFKKLFSSTCVGDDVTQAVAYFAEMRNHNPRDLVLPKLERFIRTAMDDTEEFDFSGYRKELANLNSKLILQS